MLERHPPRRDPRLLLVDARTRSIRYVALDAWEFRGLGELTRRSAATELERLALQIRPSHIVLLPGTLRAHDNLLRTLPAITHRGVAFVALTAPELARVEEHAPTESDVRAAFPEVRHLARTHRTFRFARVALGVLLRHPLPPRHYASSLPPRPAPGLAS